MSSRQADRGRPAPFAPRGVTGTITVPSSKSLTQRALVAAALAGPPARVLDPLDAEDPRLLASGLGAAGWPIAWDEVGLAVAEPPRGTSGARIEMGNNGTGVRFLLAQLAAHPGRWVLDGTARLRERPIGPLVAALRAIGARVAGEGAGAVALPLAIDGRRLAGGPVHLDAAASSQFVSALLLLGPRLSDGVTVTLASSPPSRPYLDLTAEVLEAFGARVGSSPDGLELWVPPGGLRPAEFAVEGDWSAAAFPLAAAAVAGGEVEVRGVRALSHQGDSAILGLLEQAGCRVEPTASGVRLRGPVTRPLDADLRDIPDTFPALSVVVAVAGGELTGLGGLVAKESDRLTVMTDRLTALGFAVRSDGDRFVGRGGLASTAAPRSPLDPAGDHRVAMALAVAGTVVRGTRVAQPGCVAKSWPGFWPAWEGLAGGGQ